MAQRRDLLIAAALAVATSLSRLPFVGRVLYHWDSINLALALDRLDVRLSQPHSPGYILYVLLGRMVQLVWPDPQLALAALSVVGSGLAVAALYLFGREVFDRSVAFCAALLLASSPLFFFYGAVALPHSLDAFAVTACVWLLWRLARGDGRALLPAAVALGLAGGLRPQTQIFLAPLAAYAAWKGGARLGRIAVALVALVAVDLLWFVPLTTLSGGLASFLQVTAAQADEHNRTTSILRGAGLWGLRRNGLKLSMYTLYGWGAGLAVLALGLARSMARGWRWPERDKALFFALWILPAVLFYQLIHMGQQGLTFVFLPALCLISAALLAPIEGPWRLAAWIAIAANVAIFLFVPTFPSGGERFKVLTADTLRRHDHSYLGRIAAVRGRFDAHHTVLLSAASRYPSYYLSEFRVIPYALVSRWELGEGQSSVRAARDLGGEELRVSPDAAGARYVVVFDRDLLRFAAPGTRLEWVEVGGEEPLAFVRLEKNDELRIAPESWGVVVASTLEAP